MKRTARLTLLIFILVSLTACRISLPQYADVSSQVVSTESETNEADLLMEAAFTNAKQTGSFLPVRLDYVVDGDTINILYEETSYRVRLIGINAQESVASDSYLEQTGQENTEEGKAASDYLKFLLSDTSTLYLEFDEGLYDKYHRILAYVWFAQNAENLDDMLQIKLLNAGYADLMTIEPNTKYKDIFAACLQ